MTWFTFALNVVKLLTALSTWLRERNLVQQGRDERDAENMRRALQDLAIANGVIAEFKTKGDEDVDKLLAEKGWYRED